MCPYKTACQQSLCSSPTIMLWSLLRHVPIGADGAHTIVGFGGASQVERGPDVGQTHCRRVPHISW